MGLFSPYKRHANRFNYIPRFFDPEKERREQRRAELRGQRSDMTEEYTPGQYIRTQREARAARRADAEEQRGKSVWKLVLGAAVMLLVIALLYPRLAEIFVTAKRNAARQETIEWVAPNAQDPFDQSGISDVQWQAQPITIVPNDYQE
ncbi:MAG: hypothetical protein IKY68_05780 [Alistipes sp.]|nr:hypothetical protein [Alistipes sp.]